MAALAELNYQRVVVPLISIIFHGLLQGVHISDGAPVGLQKHMLIPTDVNSMATWDRVHILYTDGFRYTHR